MHARVHFSAEPGEREQPLRALRKTLEYWKSPGTDGEPRWRGILEPHPENLYSLLLASIDNGAQEITLVSYQYDAAGLDYLTLVDYFDERDQLIGWDYVRYPEIPKPPGGPAFVGYSDLAWWEYPQMLLDIPIYLAIGIKELGGELVKSPLSAIDNGWLGTAVENRSPFSPVCFERAAKAVIEDWRNGFTALFWRFRARRRHTPVDSVKELLGILPVVGPVFDHKSPPESSTPPPETAIRIVGQGIHAGDSHEQFTDAWEQAVKEQSPEMDVVMVPYRYGGVFDIIWSLLNISNGIGYDVADQLVFDLNVSAGEGIELIGFSGSGQRFVAASRVLRSADIRVNRVVAVAAPVAGFSCAAENILLLGGNPFVDPVVLAAHVTNLFYTPLPTNVQILHVPHAGSHHLPYFPNAATRAPEEGYADHLSRVMAN